MTDAVDKSIRLWARFLSAAWPELSELVGDAEVRSDWLQASWELLIERQLPAGTLLYPYAGGADCYGESDRVFKPEVEATHVIVCCAVDTAAVDVLTGSRITFPPHGVPLEELVSVEGPRYVLRPPFDHVRIGDHVTLHVFRISDVKFEVRPITDDE